MDVGQKRQLMIRASKNNQQGFTFLEVMIALALLAAAGSILIGMQSAAVKRTIRDSSAQQALLVARRIMATIESIPDNEFDLSSQSQQPSRELMSQLQIPLDDGNNDESALEAISAELTVDDWPLPVPDAEDVMMKQIVVRVSWGILPQDAISLRLLKSFAQGQ